MKRLRPLVGIDASRAYISSRTGTENYSYQIITALANEESRFDFNLYLKEDVQYIQPGNFTNKVIPFPYLWTQGGLAMRTWIDRPDLLFIPAHVVPFLKNPFVPTVVVVHDLRTEFLPQHSDVRQMLYLNPITEKIRVLLSSHIIAVSESTKKDMISKLGVSSAKITVVYEGVDTKRFDADLKRSPRVGDVRAKFHLNNPYLLFVGTIQPRKNLVRLMEAFSKLPQVKSQGLDLVIAGRKGWMADEILGTPARLGLEQNIRFIDYVSDDDLPFLYAGATSFVFPSLYEGFGLPILEALSMRIPVVTSNVSSMPEVGGAFALYADPKNVESIAQQLSDSLTYTIPGDVEKHVSQFTWAKAGKQTVGVFDKVLHHE